MGWNHSHTIEDVDCGALGYQDIDCVYNAFRGEEPGLYSEGCDDVFEVTSIMIHGLNVELILSESCRLEIIDLLKEDLQQ